MEHQQSTRHDCSRPGCKARAECTPVLVVPSHPLSTNSKYEGCRSVLWLPLCTQHFNATTVRELVTGEVIAGMKASIDNDFRENGAIADWPKAAVQMIGRNSKEFRHYEAIYLNFQAGAPVDIAAKAEGGLPN